MNEIISCYKNYIRSEGFTIEREENGKGSLKLASDIIGEYEYDQSFNSEEELRILMLQERVNATDAIIDAVIENLDQKLLVYDGDVRVIDFIEKIRFLSSELQDIVYQLQFIDYELRQEIVFSNHTN